jgi:adenylate kinase family enzyme
MKKVIVIGSPGAGKSTFARALRDRTGLPLYYLDMLWHKPDRTNVSREEFDRGLKELLKKDCWIIDGNYLRTLELRLQECDTVFLLDYPVELCLAGAEERIGKPREDMPWVEREFDEEFRQWILDFPRDQRPHIEELLKKYREKEVIRFRSRGEAEAYLGEMGTVSG